MNKIDIIREPKGIDFVVERVKRSKEDIELVSKAITHYKATGEVLRAPVKAKKSNPGKSNKELNPEATTDGLLIVCHSPNPSQSKTKSKLLKEGSELSEIIGHLKMLAPYGKMRMTDVADTKQLFFQPGHPPTLPFMLMNW